MQIRRAEVEDAQAAAVFHVGVWRRTYRDLAPPEAHRVLDAARRLPAWQQICADQTGQSCAWLAHADGVLKGVAAVTPASLPQMDGRGEVKWLYVGDDARRTGLGRRLLQTAFDAFRDRGLPGAALTVVDGNLPAIRFYEAMGGTRLGPMTDPGPIWKSKGWIYVWDF